MQTTRDQAPPRATTELLLLALLYVGYSAARLVAHADLSTAVVNADRLLGVETVLHIDVEQAANAALTKVPGLALLCSYWYSALHYVVTPAVLIWAYRRHTAHYRRARIALVVGSAIGLVGFMLLPMAPPRMLPGYVDTLSATSGSGWWGSDASAPRGLGGLTNELAAMPSLHVGWALWCAWVVLLCSRRPLARIGALAYAAGTVAVVVATANHYVLDAVAGAAVIGVGVAVSGIWVRALPARRSRYRRRPYGERRERVRLLLIGAPGSGKGTQAVRLADRFGITHISSGDLLRKHVSDNTTIGQTIRQYVEAGDLVPDAVVADMLFKPVLAATESGGYVLDGFPRTVAQAEAAYDVARTHGAHVQASIHLDVPFDELVRRMTARSRGAEDNADVIKHRLEVYTEKTVPLLDYYSQREWLITVDGSQEVDDVHEAIAAKVSALASRLAAD